MENAILFTPEVFELSVLHKDIIEITTAFFLFTESLVLTLPEKRILSIIKEFLRLLSEYFEQNISNDTDLYTMYVYIRGLIDYLQKFFVENQPPVAEKITECLDIIKTFCFPKMLEIYYYVFTSSD